MKTFPIIQGPPLPKPLRSACVVQVNRTMMIVGGNDGSGYLDTIYLYDRESETWRAQRGRLHKEVTFPGAILVGPDAFVRTDNI